MVEVLSWLWPWDVTDICQYFIGKHLFNYPDLLLRPRSGGWHVWLNGRAFACDPKCSGFESRPVRFQVTALGKLLTACTPGSAPGLTLGNEYGRTLPFLGVQSIAISVSVCLYVCLFVRLSDRISQKPHVTVSPNFAAHNYYLWPWLGLPRTAMRYVM